MIGKLLPDAVEFAAERRIGNAELIDQLIDIKRFIPDDDLFNDVLFPFGCVCRNIGT